MKELWPPEPTRQRSGKNQRPQFVCNAGIKTQTSALPELWEERQLTINKQICFLISIKHHGANLPIVMLPVGIISDAAVVSLEMMFIVWAMKQERLMQENSLDAPVQWLQ